MSPFFVRKKKRNDLDLHTDTQSKTIKVHLAPLMFIFKGTKQIQYTKKKKSYFK